MGILPLNEGLDESAEVRLERRLSKIEWTIASGFESTHSRLDEINGAVSRHEKFIQDTKMEAKRVEGFIEGRSSLRKKDLAIVGGIVATMVTAIQITLSIISNAN